MAKLLLSVMATSIAATAIFASSASAITNEAECNSEGGTMVNLKGSDFCLVQIRPEAYRDEIYDGNQLGVTECPGNKLGDGVYCMYPVTIRETEVSEPAPEASETLEDKAMDMVKDKAEDMAKGKVKEILKDGADGK